jgi:ubiquinone/menaquinone biosynthesis C-methylase UbiE
MPMDEHDVGRHWEDNAATWTRLARAGADVYRDLVNTPAFLAMLPDVTGLHGLDIGCGEGHNTRIIADRCASMSGIDIAPTFVQMAAAHEANEPRGVNYHHAPATALPFEDETFDFATSFMCLMDMPHPDVALREAFRVVRPGGFIQFSICHPCFMTARWKWRHDGNGERIGVECGDYHFPPQDVIEEWTFSSLPEEERARQAPFRVPTFYQTLSWWLNAVIDAGFVIEELGEPCPDETVAAKHPVVADARIVAYFLHVRGRKPGNPVIAPRSARAAQPLTSPSDLDVGGHWNDNAEAWTAMSRAGADVLRDFVNTPWFLRLLPDVTDLRGLDIGCGEGANTRQVARLAGHMTAIDIAETFLVHARAEEEHEPIGIDYRQASALDLPFDDGQFDFVVAFMCFMDFPNQDRAFAEAYRVLRPGGFLQFSISHPCFSTRRFEWVRDEQGEKQALICGDYFAKEQGWIEEWTFSQAPAELKSKYEAFRVPRFDHTLSWWFAAMLQAGFRIEAIQEPYADDAAVAACPAVADTRVFGEILHVRCRKD